MSVPSNYATQIYIDGTNVSELVPYESMHFEDNLRSISNFTFTVENPASLAFLPVEGMEVFVFNHLTTGNTVFLGNIVKVNEAKRDNGITVDYELECGDRKLFLQKSVVPNAEYIGSDIDILEDLLGNVYPDLSGYFDFDTLVNNLADNLDLAVNDDPLLDTLDDLAEQAGAKHRFETSGGEAIITFDDEGWGTELSELSDGVGYHFYDGFPALISTIFAGGNPDNCVRWVDINNGSVSNGATLCLLEINLGGNFRVNQVTFDYRVSGTSNVRLIESITGQTQAIAGTGAWHSHTFTIDTNSQYIKIGFEATAGLNYNTIGLDLRFDNINFGAEQAFPDSEKKTNLVWDSSAEATDFDLDIQNGDEYGADFEFDTGGWDGYNAVIVTGASEQVAIDWTYPASGYQKQINIEKAVKDLAVFVNTGDDTTPSWSAQTLGKWGVDDIGSKDVLYDAEDAWLLFDTEPDYLRRSIRITGYIKKPIRVLVSNAPSGVPIYATTVYNANATTQEAAANIGMAALAKRNTIKFLEFDTPHPGLKVGKTVQVTDSARGLSEALVIQRITTKWIGASGHAKFHVECGEEESNDASSLIALNDKRSREKAPAVPIGTTTYEALTDDLGNVLTDDLGNILYGEV